MYQLTPKGIQDVGVFFSSVDPILMFLGQTVLVCQSYNGRYRSLSLWEGKRNMHREIQIKQFPIVTTHWWPKTQNERFCVRKRTVFISFFTSCTQPCPSEMSATHIRCVTCVCARSGSRLTEGVSEAWCWGNCHRSCRFWTVYSRIMMTFKQTRLLSSLYLYTSAPCIRFIHLEPGTVYWDMTTAEEKKKESYYDEALHVSVSFICISASTLDGGRVWSVVL